MSLENAYRGMSSELLKAKPVGWLLCGLLYKQTLEKLRKDSSSHVASLFSSDFGKAISGITRIRRALGVAS